MDGILKKTHGYEINGYWVSRFDKLWNHTEDRIKNFERQCKNNDEFTKKMLTRLKRITKDEKLYYTVAVLVERGHQDVAEIYDARLVMNDLTKDLDFLDEL